jgi:vacuolar-type H+-ATPase subunit H
MANLVDEIKIAEQEAAKKIGEARTEAARRVNTAVSGAESSVKEARQKASKEFREHVSAVEKEAEGRARELVSAGSANAKSYLEGHQGKVPGVAAWIAEEVTARYVNN